jgi:hypothetical protein
VPLVAGRTDEFAVTAVRPEARPRGATFAGYAEERPWEQPGRWRPDALPHHGRVLLLLATLGLVCGWLSCCLVVPAFVGFPLALTAYVAAKRDLAQMRTGLVDRSGHGQTEAALSRSIDGLCLNVLVVGYCLFFFVRLLSLL